MSMQAQYVLLFLVLVVNSDLFQILHSCTLALTCSCVLFIQLVHLDTDFSCYSILSLFLVVQCVFTINYVETSLVSRLSSHTQQLD